jgi:hypothetical protein
VRVAQSQFGAVREKILDAAAVTCADTETPCADEHTGLLTSLIADGDDAVLQDGAGMEEEEQDGAYGDAAATSDPKAAAALAPAGARDFDREGSTTFELGRRLRVRAMPPPPLLLPPRSTYRGGIACSFARPTRVLTPRRGRCAAAAQGGGRCVVQRAPRGGACRSGGRGHAAGQRRHQAAA